MLNIHECQVAKSDITELKILNDSLIAYATELHGIKIFDPISCEIKKSMAHVHLNATITSLAFSPNSLLFAFSSNQTIHIINIKSKEILSDIHTDGEDIDILSFDPSSTYIIAGTKKGRVLQYKYDNPTLLAKLCSFPHNPSSVHLKIKDNENFVNSFAFHNNYFACSGFGGVIYVLDLRLQTNICTIAHNCTRNDALCFLDENTLISGNNSGKIYITSLSDTKNHKSIRTPLSSIKQIIIMQNPNYIMVVGNSNIVSIIDIKKNKIAHSKYIELYANIKKIAILNNDFLFVALQNQKILRVELPSEAKLNSLIARNSIEEAFELIIKEPMLHGSCGQKELESKFDKAYLNAIKALINKNKNSAVEILSIYKNVKSKQTQIRDLFTAFKNYSRFQELFYEKKYTLAYAMCSKFPPLKQTAEYKKMEQIFKIAFSNAQKLVTQGKKEDAKALLNEYSAVAIKKPIIKMILTQNKEFHEFLEATHEKDWQKIDKLINTNELFGQMPNYTSLNNEIKNKFKNIQTSIKSGDFTNTKKNLLTLEGILHIKDRVEELYIEYNCAEKLHEAYKNNDFKSCYKILDSRKSLSATELGTLLEKHWSKIITKCEEYALEGNFKDIKKTLGELISLPSRLNRIGNLIRVSFHVRVTMLMSKKDFKAAETIIYTYMDIFGFDSEINQIMKKFERASAIKLAMTQIHEDMPTRDSWVNSMIIK